MDAKGRELFGSGSVELLAGGVEVAEGLEVTMGFRRIGVEEAGALEVGEGGVEVVECEGAEFEVGLWVGRGVFEEKFGEEMRLMKAIKLRAEMEEAQGEFAGLRCAERSPMACEGEGFIDEVAGLVGEDVFICSGEGDELADDIAQGALGFESEVGVDEICAGVWGAEGERDFGGGTSRGKVAKVEEEVGAVEICT